MADERVSWLPLACARQKLVRLQVEPAALLRRIAELARLAGAELPRVQTLSRVRTPNELGHEVIERAARVGRQTGWHRALFPSPEDQWLKINGFPRGWGLGV